MEVFGFFRRIWLSLLGYGFTLLSTLVIHYVLIDYLLEASGEGKNEELFVVLLDYYCFFLSFVRQASFEMRCVRSLCSRSIPLYFVGTEYQEFVFFLRLKEVRTRSRTIASERVDG